MKKTKMPTPLDMAVDTMAFYGASALKSHPSMKTLTLRDSDYLRNATEAEHEEIAQRMLTRGWRVEHDLTEYAQVLHRIEGFVDPVEAAKRYGASPVDLGLIDLSPKEMMFWLYCPVKLDKGHSYTVPDNLYQFMRLLDAVADDVIEMENGALLLAESYVYITAKTLWVTSDNPGSRPGWHSDGFMTDDLNYIWSDGNPTLFWERPDALVAFTQDHVASLEEMERTCEHDRRNHRTYPDKHLLRLDQGVMHRVADVSKPGMRTFVKISVSRHQYRLAGNSINHDLAPNWAYEERGEERNAPEVK